MKTEKLDTLLTKTNITTDLINSEIRRLNMAGGYYANWCRYSQSKVYLQYNFNDGGYHWNKTNSRLPLGSVVTSPEIASKLCEHINKYCLMGGE
jgi:hypothetical protein